MESVLLCFLLNYIEIYLWWIIYPFYPDIQVFLFMYHPFVDGPLKQCDMFKRTSSPSAYMMSKRPQNMASSRSKMMSDILPPPQDFVKKVSNRKPESNPNHELTVFISLVVPGGEVFSEPPRELKCRNFSSKHSFWNPATASGGEGLLFAVPGKSVFPPLRRLTCARAACCSSFEGLRWDVSCRGYAWGLINTGFPVCTVINNKQQMQSVEVVSTIVCQCFFRSPQICTSQMHGSLSYLWLPLWQGCRNEINHQLHLASHPLPLIKRTTAQSPAFKHHLFVSCAEPVFLVLCLLSCEIRPSRKVGWVSLMLWMITVNRKSSSCDHLRFKFGIFSVRIYHSGCFRDVGKPKKHIMRADTVDIPRKLMLRSITEDSWEEHRSIKSIHHIGASWHVLVITSTVLETIPGRSTLQIISLLLCWICWETDAPALSWIYVNW